MTKVFRFIFDLFVRGFHLLHVMLEVKKRIDSDSKEDKNQKYENLSQEGGDKHDRPTN